MPPSSVPDHSSSKSLSTPANTWNLKPTIPRLSSSISTSSPILVNEDQSSNTMHLHLSFLSTGVFGLIPRWDLDDWQEEVSLSYSLLFGQSLGGLKVAQKLFGLPVELRAGFISRRAKEILVDPAARPKKIFISQWQRNHPCFCESGLLTSSRTTPSLVPGCILNLGATVGEDKRFHAKLAPPPQARSIQTRLRRSFYLLHSIICTIHRCCRHNWSYIFDHSNGVCSTRSQRQLGSDGNRGSVSESGYSAGGVISEVGCSVDGIVECIARDSVGIASVTLKRNSVIQFEGLCDQWL